MSDTDKTLIAVIVLWLVTTPLAFLMGYLRHAGESIRMRVSVAAIQRMQPDAVEALGTLAWESDVPFAVKDAATILQVHYNALRGYEIPGDLPWRTDKRFREEPPR